MWGASHVHANRIEHQHGPGKKKNLSGFVAPALWGFSVYFSMRDLYPRGGGEIPPGPGLFCQCL